MSRPATVLVVEDEVLTADTISLHLEQHGYRVIGTAISYAEAVASYEREIPDVVLIDIRLNGQKTGIDFARFLRQQANPPPFIYLTSQIDNLFFSQAKQTRPAGYLSKPLQVNSLLTTVAVALYNAKEPPPGKTITVSNAGAMHRISVADILYVRADHVYVSVTVVNGDVYLDRSTLTDFLAKLDGSQFLQTHRSYVINLRQVTGFGSKEVFVGATHIPVSRNRRAEIFALLRRRLAED